MEKRKYLYLALCLLGLSQSTFGIGEESIVLGETNTVNKLSNLAFGYRNEVQTNDNCAIGTANHVKGLYNYAFGMVNRIDGSINYALGESNTIKGGHSFVLGYNNDSTGGANIILGLWNSNTGDVNYVLGYNNEMKGSNNSVVGLANQVTGDFSSVIGNAYVVTGKGSGAWGTGMDLGKVDEYTLEMRSKNEGDASYMIGNENEIAAGTSDNFILGNSVSIGEGINNSVALGTGSTVSASNEVSVGSAGKERKITNVADGTISPTSTDAVNGSQLYEISRKIEGQGLDELKKDLKRDYKKVKNEMRGIASLSAALAGLHPMQYDPYAPSQIMAAVGSYREKQAIAVGLSHYFTSNVMMSAGVALSDEKRTSTMANLGVTWKFGKGGSQASVENPQIMKSEMQRLARENQAFQAKIGSLESKVQELETALQSLLKK